MTSRIGTSSEPSGIRQLVERFTHAVINVMLGRLGKKRGAFEHKTINTLYGAALDQKPLFENAMRNKIEARRLAKDYSNSTQNFEAVSRAAAHLYAFCRKFRHEQSDSSNSKNEQSNLLAAFNREHHLTEPTSLVQKLRRHQCSVCAFLDATATEISQRMSAGVFNGLMIPSASFSGLENVRPCFKIFDQDLGNRVSIVLGGATTVFDTTLARTFGANVITNKEQTALDFVALRSTALVAGGEA